MADAPKQIPSFSFIDFLLKVSPNERVGIPDLWNMREGSAYLELPTKLPLYCATCEGERLYRPLDPVRFYQTSSILEYVTYACRNCNSNSKTFAISATRDAKPTGGIAMKYGESPPFGPTITTNVLNLLGSDADLFRKGLDSESRGLGIGAFGYYRRVLENQRSRIFDKIIEVAKKLGVDAEVTAHLAAAKDERQFTKSIEAIKPGPLKAIYVNGHNPLTLLYDTVSDGLHGQSDADNLAAAQTVRVLLTDLARRIDEALADHAEVTSAIDNLLKAKAARQKARQGGASVEHTAAVPAADGLGPQPPKKP